MASFFDNIRKSWNDNNLPDFLKDISTFGLKYSRQIASNSKSKGLYDDDNSQEDIYSPFVKQNISQNHSYHGMSTHFKKDYIGNSEQERMAYRQHRDKLRGIASQDEIEDILDTLCDETIVYDESNYFCHPLPINLDLKNIDAINAKLEANFNKLYMYYGFNQDNTAWNFFNKWLVDGFLAFEIIYDSKHKNIIGFKEIDPSTLYPEINEHGHQIWKQYNENSIRELFDSQIVYISYSNSGNFNKISYVERLVRSYNILRIMEQTRLIWAVVNSSFKLKFIIPVGGKSKNRAQQSLARLMQEYNEEISFDDSSGELAINGKSFLPFNKQIWLPKKDGDTPEVETVGGDGPDLSDTAALDYFHNKLKKVSKIPFSRFDRDGGRGSMSFSADGLERDEIRFERFISRLRAIFKELLIKPLRIQMALDFPNLKNDMQFNTQIRLQFHKYNLFEEFKEFEIMNKRIEFISSMQGLVDNDDNPIFNAKELAFYYLKLRKDDPLMKTLLNNKEEDEEDGGTNDLEI